MVGKLINNERVDTIIQTKLELWCMSLGFPTSGFFEDNGGEFSNVKLDELTSKPGITVKFGLPNLPWSNGIDEKISFSRSHNQEIDGGENNSINRFPYGGCSMNP